MTEILVVDDDPVAREIMTAALEAAGYDVREATNGADGIALARKCRPAVVVTDLMMPQKEGVEVIMELRQRDPEIAILAVSGVAGNDIYLHVARELGANAVLQKPFTFDRLIAVVSELVAARQIGKAEPYAAADPYEHRKSANEIQTKIMAAMRELDPRPLTSAEVAARLEGFAPAQQVALNMRAMAVDGRLELLGEGSEAKSYRLGHAAFAA